MVKFSASLIGWRSILFYLFFVNLDFYLNFFNFLQDIQDLLVTWAEHLKGASKIFIRAPSYNKTIFFGGRGGPLDKKDPRICTIPFATRRATFREVQRVHEVLSTVHVYGKKHEVLEIITCLLHMFMQLRYIYRTISNIFFSGKDTDISAVFSPTKKLWKKAVKPTAELNTDQEKGRFKMFKHGL